MVHAFQTSRLRKLRTIRVCRSVPRQSARTSSPIDAAKATRCDPCAAGEQASEPAQELVRQSDQHDAQSVPARPRSPTPPTRPNRIPLTHGLCSPRAGTRVAARSAANNGVTSGREQLRGLRGRRDLVTLEKPEQRANLRPLQRNQRATLDRACENKRKIALRGRAACSPRRRIPEQLRDRSRQPDPASREVKHDFASHGGNASDGLGRTAPETGRACNHRRASPRPAARSRSPTAARQRRPARAPAGVLHGWVIHSGCARPDRRLGGFPAAFC